MTLLDVLIEVRWVSIGIITILTHVRLEVVVNVHVNLKISGLYEPFATQTAHMFLLAVRDVIDLHMSFDFLCISEHFITEGTRLSLLQLDLIVSSHVECEVANSLATLWTHL